MKSALAALLFASAVLPQAPTERALPFADTAWELGGDRTAIVKDGPRDVLQVETGAGYRRDIRLENGTIDFDVQLTRRRSFVYLYFRALADGEREEIYLRPHKSALPDAIQYAPVWQNRSAWQLHHGPGGTAAVEFEPNVWTPVRLVIQGRQAAVFVKDMTTPVLIVPRMAREPRPGYIALGGFLPAGVPGTGPIARFANVVIRPDVVRFDFASAVAKAAPREAEGAAKAAEGIVRVAGENDLTVLVSDSFGGWGLMGRFVPGTGLTVEAR